MRRRSTPWRRPQASARGAPSDACGVGHASRAHHGFALLDGRPRHLRVSSGVEIARALGLTVDIYYADWTKYGRAAGPRRNAKMVAESAPTEAHAFPLGASNGTRDCIRKLLAARIPLTVHEAGE